MFSCTEYNLFRKIFVLIWLNLYWRKYYFCLHQDKFNQMKTKIFLRRLILSKNNFVESIIMEETQAWWAILQKVFDKYLATVLAWASYIIILLIQQNYFQILLDIYTKRTILLRDFAKILLGTDLKIILLEL